MKPGKAMASDGFEWVAEVLSKRSALEWLEWKRNQKTFLDGVGGGVEEGTSLAYLRNHRKASRDGVRKAEQK